MKRRKFILAVGNSLFFANRAFSNEIVGDSNNVFPTERDERREYDTTVPDAVVWKSKVVESSSSGEVFKRTIGFVNPASDEGKILYISGFLIRRDVQPNLGGGFFIFFKTTLGYLPLPRKKFINGKEEIVDKYEYPEKSILMLAVKIKKEMVNIDYKKMKLIEGSNIYLPDSAVYNAVSDAGEVLNLPSTLKQIKGEFSYPRWDVPRSYLEIRETLHFNIDHVPLRFKLELPPLVINGMKVPLPTCYFEPYDIKNNVWIR